MKSNFDTSQFLFFQKNKQNFNASDLYFNVFRFFFLSLFLSRLVEVIATSCYNHNSIEIQFGNMNYMTFYQMKKEIWTKIYTEWYIYIDYISLMSVLYGVNVIYEYVRTTRFIVDY